MSRSIIKKVVCISVLIILSIIYIIFLYEQNKKNRIEMETEIANLCEKVKDKLLEEFPVDYDDTHIMEIDEVSFSIDEIKKEEKNCYEITCTWNVNVVDSFLTPEGQSKHIYSKIEYGLHREELSNGVTTSSDNNITLIVNGNTYTPNNPDSVKDKEKKHVCAICGKEALFAESVINSKSNDWYCQEHWQDVKKYYGY